VALWLPLRGFSSGRLRPRCGGHHAPFADPSCSDRRCPRDRRPQLRRSHHPHHPRDHASDPGLVNPWGLASSGSSPLWLGVNGSGTSEIYNGAGVKQGLVVTIPGNGSVTGVVFNTGGVGKGFNDDAFLFASEDGTISSWRGALGTTAETLQTAIPTSRGSSWTPNLPAGYAPFNIQNLGGTLYVTYAVQDAAKEEDVPGVGNGIVNRFDLNGNLLGRVVTGGALNSPWGLAIAPAALPASTARCWLETSGTA
jgi:hypothetical protein